VLDVKDLRSAADRLAGRFRSMPQSRLRRGAAGEGLALARELAAQAQRLEFPGEQVRLMPDEGVFAVGDQIAVAGHELAAALERRPELSAVRDAALDRIEAAAKRCGL
jgi:hypothetical protein